MENRKNESKKGGEVINGSNRFRKRKGNFKKLTDIPAKLEKEQDKMTIFFPAGHELNRRFIQGKQNNHKGSIFPLGKKLYS